MKKVAFYITSSGWGGLEMNTLKLAGELKKRNRDVTVYAPENTKSYQKAKEYNIPVKYVYKPKKYLDINNAFLLASLLKNDKQDTVFITNNNDLKTIAWCKGLFYHRLKIVYQQHMQIGIKKKDLVHRIRYRYIDCWISPLNFLKEQVLQKTTIPEKKIKVIPLGLDTERFVNRMYSKAEALNQLNINSEGILIGTIGRIEQKKGQDFLIKALAELRKRNVNAELLIFGSPTINEDASRNYYEEIRRLVKDFGLGNVCHFIEHNEKTEMFYNSIDIFALASQGETYGMVTLEAMLSGIPVIATNSGGTPEILNHGELGKLYEVNNLNDFCDKVISLINNREESSLVAEKARKHAIENYSIETEVREIEEVLERI